MDQTLVKRYREERASGHHVNAAQALVVAKAKPAVEARYAVIPNAPDYGGYVKLERDGYEIRLSWEYDQGCMSPETDWDCQGWFYRPRWGTDEASGSQRPTLFGREQYDPKAKKMGTTWHEAELTYRYQTRDGNYWWWVPPFPLAELGCPTGASKQAAREHRLEIMRSIFERLCDFYENKWHFVNVDVFAYKAGICLGSAHLLTDWDWETQDERFKETILEHDLIDQAIEEAKDRRREICAELCEEGDSNEPEPVSTS